MNGWWQWDSISTWRPELSYLYEVESKDMTRPLLFALLCSLAVPPARCQKTEKYFDYQWHETDVVHARFYSLIEKTDSGWHRRDYFLHSLTQQMEGFYTDSACKIPSGYFRYYHPNRHIQSMGAYRDGKKQGLWMSYYSDGLLYDSTVYESGNPVGVRVSWYRSGYMRDSGNYNPDGSGIHISWFDNGQPSFAGRYAPGYKRFGKWQYFYRDGGISFTEIYDPQGRLLSKSLFDEKGTLLVDTANDDRAASFPGGQKAWSRYLSRALYFPEQYRITNGDEATVVVTATINEDGRVTDVEVAVPFYPAFDKIALEAISRCPNWVPAMDHHRKVKDYIRQPVTFSQTEP
jgi:TonB family protein